MILILMLYFICALTFTLAKNTLMHTQPIFYIGIRMIVAGAVLLGFFRYQQGPNREPLKPFEWKLMLQIMILGVYVAYTLDLWSLQYLTSTESSIVFSISPFVAALCSYIWFHETLTLKKWCGLLLGVFSLVPMIMRGYHQQDLASLSVLRLLPFGALIISVVASAYSWILVRDLVMLHNRSPILINGISMLGGGVMALITSLFVESWDPSPVLNWKQFLISTALMIVISNCLFSNLYGYLLKFYTATFISFAGFLCPLFVAILGYLFLNESLDGQFFSSMCGIAVGLIVFYQEELRQGYIKQ